MVNIAIYDTLEDKLKLVTALVGVVTLGLTAASFDVTKGTDVYFLVVVILAWLGTLTLCVGRFFDIVKNGKFWKWMDIVYHGSFAVLLTIGWILCIVNMFILWGIFSGGSKATRFFAVIFLAINVGFYGLIAWITYHKLQNSQLTVAENVT